MLGTNKVASISTFVCTINKPTASACVTFITLAWRHQGYQNVSSESFNLAMLPPLTNYKTLHMPS